MKGRRECRTPGRSTVPAWLWAGTLGLFAVLFALDFLIVGRRPH